MCNIKMYNIFNKSLNKEHLIYRNYESNDQLF